MKVIKNNYPQVTQSPGYHNLNKCDPLRAARERGSSLWSQFINLLSAETKHRSGLKTFIKTIWINNKKLGQK